MRARPSEGPEGRRSCRAGDEKQDSCPKQEGASFGRSHDKRDCHRETVRRAGEPGSSDWRDLMGMEMKLQVKMSQQLVMTPQLVQAIRLLQLSRLELVEEIRKELDGNPVLADDIAEPRRTAPAAQAGEPAQLD